MVNQGNPILGVASSGSALYALGKRETTNDVVDVSRKPLRQVVLATVLTASFPALAFAADVSQDAIDGCIDQIRAVGGPDGQSGTVISSEYSEANSLIMLKDAGNTVWRCLVSNDGVVADLTVAEAADDGGGAMAGASKSADERVSFDAGTSGSELTGSLLAQESRRYILGANEGQDLYVRVAANGPDMTYAIYNPDGSVLLDETGASQEYRGQLWQSGDHIVEVYNMANDAQSYTVIFGIE